MSFKEPNKTVAFFAMIIPGLMLGVMIATNAAGGPILWAILLFPTIAVCIAIVVKYEDNEKARKKRGM